MVFPPELLKCALGPVSRALHSIHPSLEIWRIVPADWQEGIIITLYWVLEHSAGTADRQGIGQCFAGKSLVVFSNQALPLADQQLTPSSLCDYCHSYIVNLTDHWTLHSWTLSLLSTSSIALPSGKHFAAKACLTYDLITALHKNTGARSRVGQKLSPRISTTSGVRQGCILASILFCVAIDWIIQHMSLTPVSPWAPQHSLI